MNAPIVLQVLRFGFLLLLWLFLLFAFRVIKSDLFGSGPRRVSAVPSRSGKPGKAGKQPPRPQPAPAPAHRGAPRQLVVTAGALTGTRIGLGDQPILIGRADDSTLVLTDDFASSRHARLTPRGNGEWMVEDLGSTNGTYLDRSRIHAPTPVPAGVPVRIGKTVFELRS